MNNEILIAIQAVRNRHPHLTLSIRSLAKRFGISPSYLFRIANGERPLVEKLADPDHWMITFSGVGIPLSELRGLNSAVKMRVHYEPARRNRAIKRPRKSRYLRRQIEEHPTTGPAGDVFTGPLANIAVVAAAEALERGLALSADTDRGAMVDAGTDNRAITRRVREHYLECRGGGSERMERTSRDAKIIAIEFVRLVGGTATMNAVIHSVKRER